MIAETGNILISGLLPALGFAVLIGCFIVLKKYGVVDI